jgi:squalene-associated FAD-dependent desaturase
LKHIAVVGAGWAGLAAAVQATQLGARVTLFEMADRPGGRARTDVLGDEPVDNGQHILIGAYRETLSLMRTVGVEPEAVLLRTPLALVGPDGRGLRLPPGPAPLAFARAVLALAEWPLVARVRLLATAATWAARGFRCSASTPVVELCRGLPALVMRDLVEPLCVAALNTPAEVASGQVFLRVLKDALFAGPGAADLLLPRRPLGDLLPVPAIAWIKARGADVRWRCRVQQLQSSSEPAAPWRVQGEAFDAVVLACTATEAARLAQPHAPQWALAAQRLPQEPIVTVLAEGAASVSALAAPMVALAKGPAQFVFDHGVLMGRPGRLAFVVSGAAPWVEAGREALGEAVKAQAATWWKDLRIQSIVSEKRATFRCLPGLVRPAAEVAPRLLAAGDYVEGPYPATLEGAVRAGLRAGRQAVSETRRA